MDLTLSHFESGFMHAICFIPLTAAASRNSGLFVSQSLLFDTLKLIGENYPRYNLTMQLAVKDHRESHFSVPPFISTAHPLYLTSF